MSHSVQGLIVSQPALAALAATAPLASAVSLAQGFYIVPITDELFDSLRAGKPGADPFPDVFWKLSTELASLAQELSRSVPIAYVETDYFGGAGQQAAVVWSHGDVAFPPRKAQMGPINDALRILGVTRAGGSDEFDAVGLGRARSNDDWLHAELDT